ncbi:lipoate--protein ligase [Clostridium sp. D2Q-11]|uniref:lipoate--protein ligase n=1 Tax=Anaeromonas frigoriresistens TaxID=2683708 RepID=A0A942UVK6_9FIRM|nr:lipoate--protein ligase [Anaeromonas frigoriresistens]MBS4537701.1 lipoate--protein ligase [Anaeromonas frigoriresistens]
MLYIKNDKINPHYNLALEEYALKYLNIEEDILILWQNEPSVIIGRNQNTIEEINPQYIKDNDINVVRRLSGGGAVYHDLGNLNFTFITKNDKSNVNNYKKFTQPVIDALKKLGVNAEFHGRNDIVVDGKKISGNAQYFYKDKMLHHGTILFNSTLEDIVNVLMVNNEKIKSKGIKSIRSRVTNIYPYLEEKISIDEFKDILLKFILDTNDISSQEYKLEEKDLNKINELMDDRYKKWEWNFGESPEFNIQKTKRYEAGSLDIRLTVKDGNIKECKIYGDFFGDKDVSNLEKEFINKKYDEEFIKATLDEIELNEFFYGIEKQDLIDCLFN